MNPDDHLLADVVKETLEQFAFLFGEPETDLPVSLDPAEYIEATIGFTGGGERGVLRIAAPVALCREMAGNILGLDDTDIAVDVAMDAIEELANILIGSLTARRLGGNVSCVLDMPTAQMATASQATALSASSGALCFRVDEHLFVAVFDEQPDGAQG